ncbi:hypothetical protein TrVE_jg10361 [Triparma verrucosa]|nr:hypothetical protein TrST_g11358 [Triparma strigata]GMH95171.1 hypothetical protein TrVE_jg10361 [Triparma verrucosa]
MDSDGRTTFKSLPTSQLRRTPPPADHNDMFWQAFPKCILETQRTITPRINTMFLFPTMGRFAPSLKASDAHFQTKEAIEKILTPDCVGIGCASPEVTSVGRGKGPMSGTWAETLCTVSFANFPECTRKVFKVDAKAMEENRALDETPLFNLDSLGDGMDKEDWKVIVILAPADFQTGAFEKYLADLEKRHPKAEIIGGFHSGTTGYYIDEGMFTTPRALVGMCIGGNVVYSSQISRACKPMGELAEVTQCETLSRTGNSGEEEDEACLIEVKVGDKLVQGSQYIQESYTKLMDSNGPKMMFCGLTDDEEKGYECANIFGLSKQPPGAILGTNNIKNGMKAQVFTLDPVSSKLDVAARLEGAKRVASKHSSIVLGSLLITCGGRSMGFYGEEGVEAGIFHEQLGGVGMSGFFSGGEIGPDARAALPYDSEFRGRTKLQGFTSVFGVFFVPQYKPTWTALTEIFTQRYHKMEQKKK